MEPWLEVLLRVDSLERVACELTGLLRCPLCRREELQADAICCLVCENMSRE